MKPVEAPSANSMAQQVKPLTKNSSGLQINRHFTTEGQNPLEQVEYKLKTSVIKEPDGTVIFEMKDCKIPADWSQVASDIMISKYFRKAGVPQYDEQGNLITDENGQPVLGAEKGADQVVKRLTGCWRYWGESHGYFASSQDAEAFEEELQYMLIHQMAAPNSPQWFNTGLNWAYGINGPAQGHYYCDPVTGELKQSEDSYTHPQPHACFIQAVSDDLVNDGGIMDLWTREARLFKYGSGTGSNFSGIRGEGEPLSGGGFSSGLMSFLKIGDAAAGAIKSGGTTRRAAKMVCLDADHPDIETFIEWKAKEEQKAYVLIQAGYDAAFDGEAYQTVAGQNSNNSVRISNELIKAVKNGDKWELKRRVDGSVHKTIDARDLWDKIAKAAWQCADPGVQFDSTINEWHTCPQDGRINASNPCSEYMFLDNTACNLASLNLIKFFDKDSATVDVESMRHAIRLWTIVLEISVLMAQFPSKEIAELSYKFRTLGLGYANLGTILMLSGIPYDSEKGRAICASISGILTGQSYATSAELAMHLGAFSGYQKNKNDMLRVMHNHRRAAYNAPHSEYEGLSVYPIGISEESPAYLTQAARECWDEALAMGEAHGYRNAQTTVIAPTGTIGLLMDCDTTGVEPDFALVKFKKLAGGGYFKIINQSVEPALTHLGYNSDQIKDIMEHILGALKFDGAPIINTQSLIEKGLTQSEIASLEERLPSLFHLNEAFAAYNLSPEILERFKISESESTSPDFNFLKKLGFTDQDIQKASDHICGVMTIEGAPHLKEEHLAVFDCANKCGNGERFIHHEGHIRMMAAAQQFISGAISKTINMPNEVTIKDIQDSYMLSWELGLKANAIYRDGSKHAQAMYSSGTSSKSTEEESEELTYTGLKRGEKKHMPVRRRGITVESSVGGQKIHLRTGEYEDGTLGEIFIDMFKEGASYRSLLNSLAVAVSIGLQYGVPLEKFVEKFTFTRFEPSGMTNHPNVRTCTSIIDFIFRVLGMEYNGRTDFVHVEPETTQKAQEVPATPEMINVSKAITKEQIIASEAKTVEKEDHDTMDEYLKGMMGDAPACSICGHITVRNGSCYKCLNCGNSEGCS